MNTDKLVKAIQIIVAEELKVVLPTLVKAVVKKEMEKLLKEEKQPTKGPVEKGPIEFVKPTIVDTLNQNQESTFMDVPVIESIEKETLKSLSKNPILNQILNQTQPLSLKENNNSVLDKAQRNEPAYAGAPTEVEEGSISMDSMDTHTMAIPKLADTMEYDIPNQSGKRQGLGVSTGLKSLDRILNRDNSDLIKAWDKSNGPWRPGMK